MILLQMCTAEGPILKHYSGQRPATINVQSQSEKLEDLKHKHSMPQMGDWLHLSLGKMQCIAWICLFRHWNHTPLLTAHITSIDVASSTFQQQMFFLIFVPLPSLAWQVLYSWCLKKKAICAYFAEDSTHKSQTDHPCENIIPAVLPRSFKTYGKMLSKWRLQE